jgi:kynurenine formamidase
MARRAVRKKRLVTLENDLRTAIPLSRWGANDRLGAANLLPERLDSRLLRLTGSGRLIDLTQGISSLSPRIAPGMSPFSMCMWSHPAASQVHAEENFGATNRMGFADERVEFDLHTGTHIDALGHAWLGDLTFNRLTMRDVVTNGGLRELGIENLPPVITRGVLIDVSEHLGRVLEPGEGIDPLLLERTLKSQGSRIEAGDAVFVRTGWAQFYADDTDHYTGAAPGIDVSSARWLAEQDVVMVGSDTMSLEVWPPADAGDYFPVHVELLVRSGVYILEQADLDPLATLGVTEFLCLCLTPKFIGGTASPVRLVAVA